MLRCAGCGEPVSEWASRCPGCLRSTSDAVEGHTQTDAIDAATERSGPRINVNASIDPGPNRTRAARALKVPVLVIGALGAVATATFLTSVVSGGPRTTGLPGPPRDLPGRVVVTAEDGALLVSRPDGSARTVLRTGRFAAGDAPFLVEPNGSVVAVAAGQPPGTFTATNPLPGATGLGSSVAGAASFADGDKDVVVMTGRAGQSYSSEVSAITITGGRVTSLGYANSASGDPQALGAFVAVAANPQPGGSGNVGSGLATAIADARLELRDSGHPPVLLATAAQLERDAGQPPGQPVNLSLFPDGDGEKLAVMLNPVKGGESNSPLVILDRQGRLLGVVRSGDAPVEHTEPYWSPDGTSLAYATFGTVGPMLAVVDNTFHLATQALEPPTGVQGCVWSPDSRWVLCLATSSYTEYWLLATNDATLSPVYFYAANGTPLAWLP